MSVLNKVNLRPSAVIELPERFARLQDLAFNLRWSWDEPTQKLFRSLSPTAWQRTKNPVLVLHSIRDFRSLLEDHSILQQYDAVVESFDTYMNEKSDTWFRKKAGFQTENPIAYFCAEYGLHESFPGYSGGLGILAGDHCKAASDMDLPFLAVGLMYRNGYFRQLIDPDGRQEHNYPEFYHADLPLYRVQESGRETDLFVDVEIGDRKVSCAVWLAQVGRMKLFLLDTNNEKNSLEDKEITRLLYVRGREMRLTQEIVLGIGGARALNALGIEPSVWHLNEGHSAFTLIERLGQLMGKNSLSFDDAAKQISNHSVFTIHTPVPAGNEVFSAELVKKYAEPLFKAYGIDPEVVLKAGLGATQDAGAFDMTAFCLRMSERCNGVSLLHGETAHNTWNKPTGRDIIGVTNGVHMPTWLGLSIQRLLEAHSLGLAKLDIESAEKGDAALNESLKERVHAIPDVELWNAHKEQKAASALVLKARLRNQMARNGEGPLEIAEHVNAYKQDVLTIGFARRFATYKRAALLFTDPERLKKIVDNPENPVQLLFAGKAHPADKPGQALIQDIISKVKKYKLGHRIFFVEDYDMEIGRALVQGVDVWLNNPRRPLEASGTSGMKAAANGVPNVSILDGWWDEGYHGNNGWAIGGRDVEENETLQDKNDAESLYELLETEVAKKYYAIQSGGVSKEWVEVMKNSIASSLYEFSTTRMLSNYFEKMYTEAGLK